MNPDEIAGLTLIIAGILVPTITIWKDRHNA